jgi:arabinose-5-phosphate isomerase
MSPAALAVPPALDAVALAREVLEAEADAIRRLAPRVGASFTQALELVLACTGRVVVMGIGKAGILGQKLSATFASTGTPSHFVHPSEALHGDLGRIVAGDVVIVLSNSGESEELARVLPSLDRLGVPVVAITASRSSTVGRAARCVVELGDIAEACPLGLAPTASAAALLAMGDALAMAALRARDFSREDYAHNHPGGKLGRKLRKVREVMRQGPQNPLVEESVSVTGAIEVMTRTPGRPGAALVTDASGRLAGIFTDGDLRRLIQSGETDFTRPVGAVMKRGPRTVPPDMLAIDATRILRERQIDQVPVVDDDGRPVGLLDVQDLLAAGLLGAG